MNHYDSIEIAARDRDWQECARIMFELLYRCSIQEQCKVAKAALDTYIPIWNAKHTDALKPVPEHILVDSNKVNRPELPDFPEDLDPADAEFENGLIEFYNGAFFPTKRAERTVHFATAIRSAVTARQINRWLHEHPDEYARWKSGRGIDGPTFLDDEAAADEAEMAWKFVDKLLKQCAVHAMPSAAKLRSSRQVAQLYKRWEESIL